MANYNGWTSIGELGRGGQGVVYKARHPERQTARTRAIEVIKQHVRQISQNGAESDQIVETLAGSLFDLARHEMPDELGALKVFTVGGGPGERERIAGRLASEF